jgi:hypothetical protein
MCHDAAPVRVVALQPQFDLSQIAPNDRPVIASSKDIAELFFAITHFERELMVAGAVDSEGRLVFWEIIGEVAEDGPVTSHANPFRGALEVGAASIFLVHNHKSKSLNPTYDDLELTEAVARAGMLLKFPLTDHVIVSEKGSYSILHPDNLEALGCSIVSPRFVSIHANEVAMKWKCNRCDAVNASTALHEIRTLLSGISTPVQCTHCQTPAWAVREFEIKTAEHRSGMLQSAETTAP